MNDETIREMWELTEGGEMPHDFMSTVSAFKRYKCAFRHLDFTESDFAVCVMNYKLFTDLRRRFARVAKEPRDGE